jgi:predicted dehydrogenase
MRFIQVGVGGFGKRWLKALGESPRAELVGLVDVSEEALAAAREETGCSAQSCFRSLDEALGAVRADALVCVVPPAHHRDVACAAMEAGLDVITEKPMAESPDDCRAMLECSERTGRTCVVSQNYRYQPVTWTLAELVRRGEIGEIGQISIDFFSGTDFGGGFRHEMDYPLIVDMSIHHFDLLRFITGLDAVAVRGEAWNPPWSNYRGDCSSSLVFELAGGPRAIYSASWCAKGSFCDGNANWRIEGSGGTITHSRGEIRLHRAPELYKVTETVEVPPEELAHRNQAYVLEEFVDCVGSDRRPATEVTDNIRSIAMVFAAVQAVRTGERVPVLDAETAEVLESGAGRPRSVAG